MRPSVGSLLSSLMLMMALCLVPSRSSAFQIARSPRSARWIIKQTQAVALSSTATSDSGSSSGSSIKKKGKVLVLGGTGYLGQTICQKAVLEGYSVVSLSRRGLPSRGTSKLQESLESFDSSKVDYRQGDARQIESIRNILNEGGFAGMIHCVGLLFDDASAASCRSRGLCQTLRRHTIPLPVSRPLTRLKPRWNMPRTTIFRIRFPFVSHPRRKPDSPTWRAVPLLKASCQTLSSAT